MDHDTIRRMLSDPTEFRRHVVVDCAGELHQLGDVVEAWQEVDFLAMDDAWKHVVGIRSTPPDQKRFYLERPRGHSKTTDQAIMATWGLLASQRPLSGLIAAADRDQAALVMDAVRRLVAINGWMSAFLTVRQHFVTNTETGSRFEVLASDAASSFGHRPDAVLCDEVTHWGESGQQLWASLLSAVAKRPSSMLTVISNAGLLSGSSWQWNVREHARTDPRWHFHSLDGVQASWISPADIDEQRRLLLPSQFSRLWLNVWSHPDGGDALPQTLIDAAVTLPGPSTSERVNGNIVAGLDLAVRRDHSALVVLQVVHDQRKVRLLHHERWAPADFGGGQIDLEAIFDAVIELNERFPLLGLVADSWQSEALCQRWRSRGLHAVAVAQTVPELDSQARTLLRVFQDQQIELYKAEDIIADLQKIRLVERAGGQLRITAPRDENGHADIASALAVALPAAMEVLEYGVEAISPETSYDFVDLC